MFENPSAGKFDPPSVVGDTSTPRLRPRRFIAIMFVALVYPLVRGLNAMFPDYHLMNASIGLVLFGLASGVRLILHRSRSVNANDPYSPPTHITR